MAVDTRPSASRDGANGATTTRTVLPPSSPVLDHKALLYMMLLAVQFGVQPILTRRYTPEGITRSTVVFVQEIVKFCIACTMLNLSGELRNALKDWTIQSWLSVAVVPAALYSLQNICALTAYQTLDALTFNVLNQTKTLSAALCCYLVMGRRQSPVQIFALVLLLLAALVMEGIVNFDRVMELFVNTMSTNQNETAKQEAEAERAEWKAHHVTHGLVPIMVASFISGLAGALSQKNLQASRGRNAYLFSMELCLASCIILLGSMVVSPDGHHIMKYGFWNGWTPQTFIPILTGASGGILVGLVTKYAGSVRKGFALIFGMLLSGVLQEILQPDVGVSPGQVAGGLLAAISLFLHATFPPRPSASKKKKED